MRRLPQIPYTLQKNQREIVAMRGINYSEQISEGDLADSLNISARRWPYITTRKERVQYDAYENATALTAWNKLVVVVGNNLLYDGVVVGHVTAGQKQFAVVNTRLIIWPDKVYLDLNTQTVKPLDAEICGVGALFTDNTVTIAWQKSNNAVDLRDYFKPGDGLTLSGCEEIPTNNKSFVIKELSATVITVDHNTFAEGDESDVVLTLTRSIPDMDFICESENRLWGCSSSKQTIYASALGDPANFNVFEGLSTDSYALAVGSAGDFTGCCKLGSSVLFWKETTLHKVLGSYPAEYSLYTYTLEGLKAGCEKSMQIINEVLFYVGLHGVYSYAGGTPSHISANFGNREFTEAVAGNDGDSYYLAVKEGDTKHLFVYETRCGIWVHEDNIYCLDFARIGRELYMLQDNGNVYLTVGENDSPHTEWFAQFTPFYETIQGRKVHSKLILRLELPKGSYISAHVRFNGGVWKEIGKIIGRSFDAIPLRIVMERCDKFELKLTGKGPCTILSIMREFSVESEV